MFIFIRLKEIKTMGKGVLWYVFLVVFLCCKKTAAEEGVVNRMNEEEYR